MRQVLGALGTTAPCSTLPCCGGSRGVSQEGAQRSLTMTLLPQQRQRRLLTRLPMLQPLQLQLGALRPLVVVRRGSCCWEVSELLLGRLTLRPPPPLRGLLPVHVLLRRLLEGRGGGLLWRGALVGGGRGGGGAGGGGHGTMRLCLLWGCRLLDLRLQRLQRGQGGQLLCLRGCAC